LKNGIEQFTNYDEDTETELMMLPTDIALTQDKAFRPWVELYARDKERFFDDFSKVFAKLVELGIQRDENGVVTNTDDEKGGYHSAPKKSTAGSPVKSTDDEVGPSEGEPLKEANEAFRARL
jgi:cytochrome c peroxidase